MLAIPVVAGDQVPATNRYLIKSWQTTEGLPQNSVFAIEQTPDGYLWVGTKGGLARFDGVRFKSYGVSDGLKSPGIHVLLNDGDGGLWIGTSGGGLGHLQQGKISTITVDDGLLHNDIYELALDANGGLWIGTGLGLQRWTASDGLVRIGADVGVDALISGLAIGPENDVWFTDQPGGLYRFQNGACTPIDLPLARPRTDPPELMFDRSGALWASIGNGKVLVRRNEEWIEYNQSDGLPFSVAYCFLEDSNGAIWVGSQEGGLCVREPDDEKFRPIEKVDASIRSLIQTDDGAIWVGTRTGGLTRITRAKVETHAINLGSAAGELRAIAESESGEIWAATWGAGAFRGEMGAVERLDGYYVLDARPFFLTVHISPTNDVYLVHPFFVFCYRESQDLEVIPVPEAKLHTMTEANDGSLFVAGRLGNLRQIVTTLVGRQAIPVMNGETGAPIIAMAPSQRGGVWIATVGAGLFHWANGTLNNWTTADGLPSDIIQSIFEDDDGAVWIGTAGGGMAWLANDRIEFIDQRHGLLSDFVSAITDDELGYLWLGTMRGIVRVSKDELARVAAGQDRTIHPLHFDDDDGMSNLECNDVIRLKSSGANKGKLLFATPENLIAIDPTQIEIDDTPPTVLIESISADGNLRPVGSLPIVLPKETREISFQFTSFNYLKPKSLRFRHRLNGMDDNWIDDGADRSARYAFLPPGQYVLEVSAAKSNGRWNPQPATVAFSIAPYFWQTRWFQALILALITAFGASIAWWLARIRIRRAEERARLSRAEAEALQRRNEAVQMARIATLGEHASLIAHELNQPLSAILSNAQAGKRMLANPDVAQDEFRAIFQDIIDDDERASEVIQRIRNLVKKGEFQQRAVDLNDLVRHVLQLMSWDLEACNVSVTTKLDERLPPFHGDRVHIQQVMLNLLLNACDAMESCAKDRRKLTITTSLTSSGSVQVAVSDTGTGFATGREKQIFEAYYTTKENGLGLGLSLSHSIIVAHGGRMWGENGTHGGALLCFTLPIWKGETT